MPASSSPSTSRRLLSLLSLLQARRDWPAHTLARKLAVSERTIRRDVDRLRELDYAIEATRGPDGGYRLGAGSRLPPLMFDENEALAIALTLQTASSLGADIADDAERALATLRRFLPSHLTHRLETLAVSAASTPRTDAVDPALLLLISDAIRTQRELRFDYASPNRTSEDQADVPRHTEPHHILMHDGRWYLLGYSSTSDAWRTYRVDRITPRSHTGAAFTPRVVPGADPARYLAAHFKGATDGVDRWACWGSVTLRAPLDRVAPFIGDGTAEALTDATTRVTLGAWSWGALAASVARFEAEMTDAEPHGLRAAFAELGRRALTASVIRPV